MARRLASPDDIRATLAHAEVIAVLGAHPDPARPAHYVPAYLRRQGYRVLPVNPLLVGTELWGEPVRATLAELDVPVDIVDVFRRAELLPAHLGDLRAMVPPPKVVWLQSGIRHAGFAAALLEAGIDVVEDRCTYADHRAFGLPAR